MSTRTLSELTPNEFENLTYDLLQIAGMKTLVWRTPGADGGRDIEGIFPSMDFSGYYTDQKWYVECKLYTSSIDWPTIWKKIAYADGRDADFLLLVTNTNPSPNCENEINNWNMKEKSVVVRVWRGYEFDQLLKTYPSVAAKHGFLERGRLTDQSLLQMMIEMMKIAQASFAAHEFGRSLASSLEANAALSELISIRMDELRNYGKILAPSPSARPPDYDWLTWYGPFGHWDEAGIRSFLTLFRHVTCAATLHVEASEAGATINAQKTKCALTGSMRNTLAEVALWSDIELVRIDDAKAVVSLRTR